eukprot:m.51385 g.51385  ORF g.51385 m.51385 type:complete len:622 (+) comp10940_c0_seq1:163-2028(+)
MVMWGFVSYLLLLFKHICASVGVSTVAASFLLSYTLSSLLTILSGVFSRLLSKTYKSLNPLDQLRWNGGINRAAQGVILGIMGAKTFFDGVPEGGTVHGVNDSLLHIASFSLGFFVYELRDALNMLLAHNVKEESLLFHHFLGVLLYFLTLSTQSYLFLSCAVLVQELHSPFTHIGWMLAKQGRDNSILWDINQYVLIAVWLIFREGCDLFVWVHIITNLPYGFLGGPFIPLSFILCGTIVLTMYLNPWWFRLKIRQFHKRDAKHKKKLANQKRSTRQRQQQQQLPPQQSDDTHPISLEVVSTSQQERSASVGQRRGNKRKKRRSNNINVQRHRSLDKRLVSLHQQRHGGRSDMVHNGLNLVANGLEFTNNAATPNTSFSASTTSTKTPSSTALTLIARSNDTKGVKLPSRQCLSSRPKRNVLSSFNLSSSSSSSLSSLSVDVTSGTNVLNHCSYHHFPEIQEPRRVQSGGTTSKRRTTKPILAPIHAQKHQTRRETAPMVLESLGLQNAVAERNKRKKKHKQPQQKSEQINHQREQTLKHKPSNAILPTITNMNRVNIEADDHHERGKRRKGKLIKGMNSVNALHNTSSSSSATKTTTSSSTASNSFSLLAGNNNITSSK